MHVFEQAINKCCIKQHIIQVKDGNKEIDSLFILEILEEVEKYKID